VRGHVGVALSGDGGDEMFGGYARYGWGRRLETWRRLPAPLRRGAAALAETAPIQSIAPSRLGRKLQRAATLGAAEHFVDSYRQLLSLTSNPAQLLASACEHHPPAWRDATTAALGDGLRRMQTIDALSYLPDDILVKVDRASMSVGLEVRVPLLDHRIWEWSMRLPERMQRARGAGKAVLRAVLARHLPAPLFDRPKAGFAVPLARWLRGELKDWAGDLLASGGWRGSGLFDNPAVDRLWAQHHTGRRDHGQLLWSILMFESWRRSVVDVR